MSALWICPRDNGAIGEQEHIARSPRSSSNGISKWMTPRGNDDLYVPWSELYKGLILYEKDVQKAKQSINPVLTLSGGMLMSPKGKFAKGGIRTPTGLPPLPPQGSASTNFATFAYLE